MTTDGLQRSRTTRSTLMATALTTAITTAVVAASGTTAHAVTRSPANLGPNRFGSDVIAVGAPGRDAVRVEYPSSATTRTAQWLYARPGSTQHQDFGATVQWYSFSTGKYLVVGAPKFKPKQAGAAGAERGALEVYKLTSKGMVWAQLILGSVGNSHLGAVLASPPNTQYPVAPLTNRDPLLVAAQNTAQGNVIVFARNNANTAFTRTGSLEFTTPPVTSLAYGAYRNGARTDIAVGSAGADSGAGVVTMLYGGGTPWQLTSRATIHSSDVGLPAAPAKTAFGTALASGIRGQDIFDSEGKKVATAGGPSLVVGAPGAGGGGVIVSMNSAAAGLDTASKQLTYEIDVWPSLAAGRGYGSSVVVGRVKGNYDPEIVVGAPTAQVAGHANAGAVFVGTQRVTQATAGIQGDPQHDAYFGRSLAMPPIEWDERGPAYGPVLIGAPLTNDPATDSGQALYLQGGFKGLSQSGAHTATSVAGARFGTSVAVTY